LNLKIAILCKPKKTLDGFFRGFNAISVKIFFQSHIFSAFGTDGFSKNSW